MQVAIERIRPTAFRRYCPGDRRQVVLAWATPTIFVVVALSVLAYNDPSFLAKGLVKSGVTDSVIPVSSPVDWTALPWVKPEMGKREKRQYHGIEIHGDVSLDVKEIYEKRVPNFEPRHVDLQNVQFSPDGHVLFKGHAYPDQRSKLFGDFDPSSVSAIKEQNKTFDRLIPIQAAPETAALDSLMHILPLMFSLPDSELLDSVVAVPRSFVDFRRLFAEDFCRHLDLTVLHSTWADAKTARVLEIPGDGEFALSCLEAMSAHLVRVESNETKGFVVLPGRTRTVSTRELVAEVKNAGLDAIEMEPTIDLPLILETMNQCLGVIGVMNRNLEVSCFMEPGSTVIEIQTPDYVSEAAVIAAEMGMKVHLFVLSEGRFDIEGLVEVMKKAEDD